MTILNLLNLNLILPLPKRHVTFHQDRPFRPGRKCLRLAITLSTGMFILIRGMIVIAPLLLELRLLRKEIIELFPFRMLLWQLIKGNLWLISNDIILILLLLNLSSTTLHDLAEFSLFLPLLIGLKLNLTIVLSGYLFLCTTVHLLVKKGIISISTADLQHVSLVLHDEFYIYF